MTTNPSGNNKNEDDKTNAAEQPAPLPPSPFTTTTDVMNSLNKVMQQYHNPDQDSNVPAFELQRKLPDGSSRKASPSELKAADLETKIKQVAQHVASLPNQQAKLDFVNQQRQYGNQLYSQEEYEQAMDVYLTCLTAIPTTNRGQSLVFLQVLNNLAQTAMQLTWYRKAQDFCRLALEEVYNNSNDAVVDMAAIPAERQVQIAKLYFKRGKASRFKGEYEAARNDLTQALSVLAAMNVDDDSDNHVQQVIESSRKAIRKELQAVQVAAQEGRKNKLRHQKAMQKVLGGGQRKDKESSSTTTSTTANSTRRSSNSVTFANKDTLIAPLYDDMPRCRQRAYSTLRAPTTPIHNNDDYYYDDDVDDDDDLANVPMGLRYWYYYIRMVGRVAETLLEWIGDDGDEEKDDGARPATKAGKMD